MIERMQWPFAAEAEEGSWPPGNFGGPPGLAATFHTLKSRGQLIYG